MPFAVTGRPVYAFDRKSDGAILSEAAKMVIGSLLNHVICKTNVAKCCKLMLQHLQCIELMLQMLLASYARLQQRTLHVAQAEYRSAACSVVEVPQFELAFFKRRKLCAAENVTRYVFKSPLC